MRFLDIVSIFSFLSWCHLLVYTPQAGVRGMHQRLLSYMLLLQTETAQVDRKKQLDEMSDYRSTPSSLVKRHGQRTGSLWYLNLWGPRSNLLEWITTVFQGFFPSCHYFQTIQISIKQKNKLITMMLNPSDQLPSKIDKKIEPRGKIAPKGKKRQVVTWLWEVWHPRRYSVIS